MRPEQRSRLLAGIGLTAVLALSLLTSYRSIPDTPEIQVDSVNHLLLARDCLGGGNCYLSLGPFGNISITGVSHGALWTDFLIAVSWLGGGFTEYYLVIAAWMALAVALVFVLGRKLFGNLAGLTAALLCPYLWEPFITPWSPGVASPPILWNPVLLPLPAALFLFSACAYAATRRLRFLLAASLTFGVGLQLHLSFAVLSPVLAYLIAITPRGLRLERALLSLGLPLILVQLVSPDMFRNIRIDLGMARSLAAPVHAGIRNHSLLACFGALGALAAALCLARRRAAGPDSRGILMLLLVTYLPLFLLASIWRPEEVRYVAPLVPGLALLAVGVPHGLIQAFFKRRARGADALAQIALILVVLGGIGNLLRTGSQKQGNAGRPALGMADAELVASHLVQEGGWSYPDVYRHLRGGVAGLHLLYGLMYYLPRSQQESAGAVESRATLDMAVLQPGSGDVPEPLPSGWQVLRPAARTPILLYRYQPFLRWDVFSFCFRGWGDASPCRWRPARYRFETDLDPRDRHLWFARAFPGLKALSDAPACPYSVVIRVPVQVPARQRPRTIVMPRSQSSMYCPGAIVSVSGVPFQGRLPGDSITLLSRDREARGQISFWWDFCADGCKEAACVLPPAVLEFDPESLAVYRSLDGGAPEASPGRPSFGGRGAPPPLWDSPAPAGRGGPAETLGAASAPRPLLAPRWYILAASALVVVGLGLALAVCLGFRPPSGPAS